MADNNLISRFRRSWNAFFNKDPTGTTTTVYHDLGPGYSARPDRTRFTRGNERSIVVSVLNRIAMDAAAMDIRHVELDENGRFLSEKDSGLNNCLKVETNVDQIPRAFVQDVVMSMMDEGSVALVPTDTDSDPSAGMPGAFDILEMRTGKITEWYPKSVKLEVYDENAGYKKEIVLPKRSVAIVENPLYAVMNEPNSTMQRLVRKLNLLDLVDEQNSSGKLDLIIQLPYVIKSEARKQQAETRRKDIETQLTGSKYGIAYTDGTEHITQLNRPVENNLLQQVKDLKVEFFSQLGITEAILNGTADDKEMLNYYNRTIEPILSAITDEMKRKFLTKTARSQRQSIAFFRDPFKLVPVADLAEIADKFTRNEIMTSNEFRQVIGMKPSSDPKADQLVNSNMPQQDTGVPSAEPVADENQNGDIDDMLDQLDEIDANDQELDDMESEVDSA